MVLGACVLATLPLELLGASVYRRPRRLARAVLPAALLFSIWDAIAVSTGAWSFDAGSVLEIRLPFGLPLEEMLFFVIIPVCGILTYEAVGRTMELLRRKKNSS
jgi:lycopene cyclase domain-containing protein